MGEITPRDPAEVGQDQSMVTGGYTGHSVLYISHLYDYKADKEKLLFWAYLWLFGGSDGVLLGRSCVRLLPQDPAEIDQDQSRVVGGYSWPSVPQTSHLFDS